MAHALALAARGLGQSWPNPAVGCVIVKEGRILGRGWTQAGGRPHGETMALAQAGARAHGATAYVTLEPCAHHGQTPPCASALIGAGVARVVTSLTDPDARVSGRGHAMLRDAGLAVREGVLETEARALNAGFLKRVARGLPYLALKLATSLDGRIATATGQSRWISGPEARRAVHALRLSHDAVLIGAGTARADDPDLRARDLGATHQPVRIVIDSRLSHAPESRLGRSAAESAVWIIHTPAAPAGTCNAWQERGATLIEVAATGAGQVDLTSALRSLAARGLTRILCEGGATLASALLRHHLVDSLIHVTAGRVIGADGLAALAPLGVAQLADAPALTLAGVRRVGPDTWTHWKKP